MKKILFILLCTTYASSIIHTNIQARNNIESAMQKIESHGEDTKLE
jgi:hypothetical protein